jgi:uncharacterized membrane protein SpoIIM required for sporulation
MSKITHRRFLMTTSFLPVVLVLVAGWFLASTLGSWAYFANKPEKESK